METVDLILAFVKKWYIIPVVFMYIGVIVTILIENRNPTKTISWILVIFFLPVIGLILYYFFGQTTKKLKKIRKAQKDQYERISKELKKYEKRIDSQILKIKNEIEGLTQIIKAQKDQYEKNLKKLKKYEKRIDSQILKIQNEIDGLSQVFQYLRNERISVPTLYNDVKLLINGEEKFKYLLESLKGAKHSIHLEYYIFELDNIGTKILNILEEKYQEGVEVRLIIDSFGSPKLIRYLSKNKERFHFEWQAFLPVTFASLADSNYRDHRKIAVIDGDIGYVGGINISDRYINREENNLYWRDTSVRIEGDAVGLLQINFWDIWNQTDGAPFSLREDKIKELYKVKTKKYTAVSFALCDPASPAPYSMESILISLGQAKEKIQLITPYYIPNEELETALMSIAATGVQVELIIPKRGDSNIVRHASFSFLKPLLKRGVKVYLYNKGVIHAKTINVDNKLSFVGTVNLDI